MHQKRNIFENFALYTSMKLQVRINSIWIDVKEVVVLKNRVCFVKEDDSYLEIDLGFEDNKILWQEYNRILAIQKNVSKM